MLMIHDGVEMFCLPDSAVCMTDDEKRSPSDIDECPIGCEVCTGDCIYYAESN